MVATQRFQRRHRLLISMALISLFDVTNATLTAFCQSRRHRHESNLLATPKKSSVHARSKRVRLSKSRGSIPSKKLQQRRQSHGGKLQSEEELARHVQQVFQNDFADFSSYVSGGEECAVGSDICADDLLSKSSRLDYCKKLDAHPALVLNADYQPLRMLPLSIWSWQDTVKAVFTGKVVVVDVYPDITVRAVSLNMPVPSVIALREYAPAAKAKPAFTRRNVFLRDGYRCQYCNGLFRTSDLSLDHVEPRCRGGKLTWDNTVTSCRKCNGRKGSLRLSELHSVGMTLQTPPRVPSMYELAAEAHKFVPRKVHPTWAPYLGLSLEPSATNAQYGTKVKVSETNKMTTGVGNSAVNRSMNARQSQPSQ